MGNTSFPAWTDSFDYRRNVGYLSVFSSSDSVAISCRNPQVEQMLHETIAHSGSRPSTHSSAVPFAFSYLGVGPAPLG